MTFETDELLVVLHRAVREPPIPWHTRATNVLVSYAASIIIRAAGRVLARTLAYTSMQCLLSI